MQTSLGSALRALVMLACLIAVPLVALSGGKLPDLLKKFFAPPFHHGDTVSVAASGPGAAWPWPGIGETQHANGPCSPSVGSPGAGAPATADPFDGTDSFSSADEDSHRNAVVPAAYQEMATDRLVQVQQRLKALGATYYLLESWGNKGEHYRFQCRMPIGHSPGALRCFEATDTDGLRAMGKVLEQIEAWKSQSR